MKRLPLSIALGASLMGASGSLCAQPLPPVLPDRSFRDSQELMRAHHWQEQRKALESSGFTPATALPDSASDAPVPAGEAPLSGCLPWHSVRVEGLDILSSAARAEITAASPQGCLNAANLNGLSRSISAAMLSEGLFQFTIRKVAASETPAQQGDVLIWRVIPARVSDIRNSSTIPTAVLFPNLIGKPVRTRDLDQALAQANRLPGHSVSLDVFPDGADGVVLAVSDAASRPLRAVVSADNAGPDAQHALRVGAQVLAGNPLGLGDSLWVYANSSLGSDDDVYSRYGGLNYSVPYGYWTFSGFANLSASRGKVVLPRTLAEQSGDIWQAGGRAERVIARSQRTLTSAYAQLVHMEVTNRFMGDTLAIQSPKLTTVALGLNHTWLNARGSVQANAEIERGLPVLHADHDVAGSGLPQAQFTRVSGSLYAEQNLTAAPLPLRWEAALTAQASPDNLPAVKTLNLSDPALVRGLGKVGVSGRNGVALHQNLVMPTRIGRLSVSPYLGVDIGSVQPFQAGRQSALSATLGARLGTARWGLDAAVTKARYFDVPTLTNRSGYAPTLWFLQGQWMF